MSICKQELLTVLFYGLWISCNKGDNKISSICSFIWQSFAHIKTFLIVWRLPQLEWNIHLIERFYLTCETTSINHQCLKLTPENVWLFHFVGREWVCEHYFMACTICGRFSGLVVCLSNWRLEGYFEFESWLLHCLILCSYAKHFTLTLPMDPIEANQRKEK